MKKYIVMPILLFLINCSEEVITKKEIFNNIKINLKINNASANPCYHIYFKNNASYTKSFSKNLINSSDTFFEIKPGNYSFYILSLSDKSTTSKFADKIYFLKTSFYEDKILPVDLIEVYPEAAVMSENSIPKLILNFQKYENIFSLSSLSLKQGTDRARSLTYNYDELNKRYTADIPLYQNGEWLLNTSYTVKAGAQDEKKLSEDNINLSTTAFTNINLGIFNFIE